MADLGTQSGKLFHPYVEFTINGAAPAANPFDEVCTVVFTHTASQEQITCEAFYDGDYDWELDSSTTDVWKIRFAGTKTGEWTFATSSANGGLDGHTGTINVSEHDAGDEDLGRGFVEPADDNGENGRKWRWSGSKKALIPNLAMVGEGTEYYSNNPLDIDGDITEFMTESGMSGFHYSMYFAWFGINEGQSTDISNPASANLSPSIVSIAVLEDVITKVYEAGGMVHLWAWGDDSRSQSPVALSGGINGSVHQRLQRYVAARLGAVPGWTMGAGYDLHEEWTGTELENWRSYYNSQLGWDHVIGGRAHQNDQAVTTMMTALLDYKGHEDHETINYDPGGGFNIAYDRFLQWMNEYTSDIHFSEDRFRAGGSPSFPSRFFSEQRLRRTLWHTAMAGGVAAIYGERKDSGQGTSYETQTYDGAESRSFPFENKNELKIFGDFWNDRFDADLQRNNNITDGYGLKSVSKLIAYKEDASAIDVDLTGHQFESAIAVDLLAASYTEIDITNELTADQNNTYTTPSTSDWVVFVQLTEPTNLGHFPITSDSLLWTDAGHNNAMFNLDHASVPAEFWSNVANDGGNIRVYFWDGQDEIQVDRKVIGFDKTGQVGRIYFVASNSVSGANEWRIYLEDIGVEPESQSVFPNMNVYPLEEIGNGTADEFKDIGDLAAHGTGGDADSPNAPTRVASQIGFGQDFDGVDEIIVANPTVANTVRSWSAIIHPGASGQSSRSVVFGVQQPNSTHGAMGSGFRFTSANLLQAEIREGANSGQQAAFGISVGTAVLAHGVYNGTDLKLYVGGQLRDTNTVSMTPDAGELVFGAFTGKGTTINNRRYEGVLDEARFADGVEWSAEYVETDYNIFFDHDNLWSVGAWVDASGSANEVTGTITGGGELSGITEAPDIAPNEVTGSLSGNGELAGITEAPAIAPNEVVGTLSGNGELAGITQAPVVGAAEVVGTISGGGELAGITEAPAIEPNEVVGVISGNGDLAGITEAPDPDEQTVTGLITGGGELVGITEAPTIEPNEVTGLITGGGELAGVLEAPAFVEVPGVIRTSVHIARARTKVDFSRFKTTLNK